ncbi:MAG: hypothetical protein MI741_02865, partial [Rhodospirillales bacterium]|nr:hypothetical protein [Rhodospirillales bacterium]
WVTMPRKLANIYTAISGTGYRRYIEDFYDDSSEQHVINMQIRYWIEAVEKFNNLPESEYGVGTVEEGILIINLLGNSLLTLGGVNWQGSSNRVPPLLELYGGDPFPLKQERPELFMTLERLNDLYNKLSKHFSLERSKLFPELTFQELRKLYDATAEIWLFVCHYHHASHDFDHLFMKPEYFVRRGYYPGDNEEQTGGWHSQRR